LQGGIAYLDCRMFIAQNQRERKNASRTIDNYNVNQKVTQARIFHRERFWPEEKENLKQNPSRVREQLRTKSMLYPVTSNLLN